MQWQRAVLVSAITTALVPVVTVYAADATPRPQTEAAENPQLPQAASAPHEPSAGIRVESRSTPLNVDLGAAPATSRSDELRYGPVTPVAIPSSRADDFRYGPATGAAVASSRAEDLPYGFPSRAAGGTGLRLSPPASAPKPGWELSGRVGPLRFLSPLDGEGETKLRLGGRLPGQPRMPGMGLFNVGVHYNFE